MDDRHALDLSGESRLQAHRLATRREPRFHGPQNLSFRARVFRNKDGSPYLVASHAWSLATETFFRVIDGDADAVCATNYRLRYETARDRTSSLLQVEVIQTSYSPHYFPAFRSSSISLTPRKSPTVIVWCNSSAGVFVCATSQVALSYDAGTQAGHLTHLDQTFGAKFAFRRTDRWTYQELSDNTRPTDVISLRLLSDIARNHSAWVEQCRGALRSDRALGSLMLSISGARSQSKSIHGLKSVCTLPVLCWKFFCKGSWNTGHYRAGLCFHRGHQNDETTLLAAVRCCFD